MLADKLRTRTVCVRGQGKPRTWTVCGLAVDWTRPGHGHGHRGGQWRGHFWPNRSRSADIARPPRGRQQAATEMMRDQCADTIPDAARTLPGRQATAARLLLGQFTGHCADDSPDTARSATRTAVVIARSFAHLRANLGADIHQHLVRRFPPTARTRLGNCSAITRMIRRTLRRMLRGLLR